jgi:hypothetical protein
LPPPVAAVTITASGSVVDYDDAKKAELECRMASKLSVACEEVSLHVVAASVLLQFTVAVADAAAATAMKATIDTALGSDTTTLSYELDVTVEAIAESVVVGGAPTPPPSSPPPSSPPPPPPLPLSVSPASPSGPDQAGSTDNGGGDSLPMPLIIGAAAAAAVVVAAVVAFGCLRKKKRVKRLAELRVKERAFDANMGHVGFGSQHVDLGQPSPSGNEHVMTGSSHYRL